MEENESTPVLLVPTRTVHSNPFLLNIFINRQELGSSFHGYILLFDPQSYDNQDPIFTFLLS